jgi:bifunctional non-homologous end joining protein LigD
MRRTATGRVWQVGDGAGGRCGAGGVRFLVMKDVRPAFVMPMKAVLTAERPAGSGWVFERKLDGIRCLAVKDGGRTWLYSRNELALNDRYAPLAAALDADVADGFVIDGEAVAFVGGRDRFGGGEGGELFYYVFDVLFAGGRDVRSLPLQERRDVLEGVLRWRDPLRITEQMTGDGALLLEEACRDGWEGLIAKRLGTPYVSTRSHDWLKLKCTRAQELVAQIAFREWTPDGRLRHPSFLGVRFDKPAREVVRERPE